jgi:16S rRNA (guanine966-N2)-methyltransferase
LFEEIDMSRGKGNRPRITAGSLRGFKVEVPEVETVRPPLEMLRQAVFNILGQDLEDWTVLDLFSGSGVMGIEGLSRGAKKAVFVERDREAVKVLKCNLEKTRTQDRADVVTADAFKSQRYLAGRSGIDAVFVDPPFAMIRSQGPRERISGLVDELFASPALSEGAVVVLRVPKGEDLKPAPGNADLDDDRTYGHSRVLFYVRKGYLRPAGEPGDEGDGSAEPDGEAPVESDDEGPDESTAFGS